MAVRCIAQCFPILIQELLWSVLPVWSCIIAGSSARSGRCCSSAACSPPASSVTGGRSTSRCPVSPATTRSNSSSTPTASAPSTPTSRSSRCPRARPSQENQDAVAEVFATAVAAVPDVTAARRRLREHGRPGFVTDDGRTTFALIQAPVPVQFGPVHRGRARPRAREGAAESRGFESGLTSYGLLVRRRRPGGAERPGRDAAWRGGCAPRPALRVRVVPRAAPAADRRGVDPDDVHARARTDDVQRRQHHRPVPHRPDRARCGDRLLAAPGVAMARGARTRTQQRGSRHRRDEDGWPRRDRLGCHRRDQPARPARRPGARPAEHGDRGHADPAGERGRGADSAAGAAVQHRSARRLPAHPQRRHGVARLVGVGASHRPTPLRRHRRGRGHARPSHHPGVQPQDRARVEPRVRWRRVARGTTPCRP